MKQAACAELLAEIEKIKVSKGSAPPRT